MKHDFRIKLQGDSRAVSYKNIEANLMQYNNYIDVKGVKTMIRQYLKSMYKDVYKLPIKFKYKKTDGILEVVIDGIKQPNFGKLIKAFDQFTYENSPKTDIKSGKELTFLVSRINLFNGTPFETPNATPTTTPAPTPAPQTSGGLPKATRIYIHTHEGTGEFDNMIFKTWSDLQNALEKIYDNWLKNPHGYDKVKVEIEWENGKKLLDRIDVGDDFKPYQTFIGEYLKEQNGAMFSSNFDKRPSPDDRDSVSWTDEAQSQSSSTQQPEEQPEQEPMETNKLPLSYIEVYDVKKTKLLKRFTNWTDADNYFESIWLKLKPKTFKDYVVEIDWGGTQVRANTTIRLDAEEYYPDGNDEFYDRFLVNWFYSYTDTDKWKNVRDTLQWTDSNETPNETPQSQPQQQEQQPQTQMPQNTSTQTTQRNRILTDEELSEIYGSLWRNDLDWIDELDVYLGKKLTDEEVEIFKSGENLSVEVEDYGTFEIPVETTTLACYHDYNEYTSEEISQITIGLIVFKDMKTGTEEEQYEANILLKNLTYFKETNK